MPGRAEAEGLETVSAAEVDVFAAGGDVGVRGVASSAGADGVVEDEASGVGIEDGTPG